MGSGRWTLGNSEFKLLSFSVQKGGQTLCKASATHSLQNVLQFPFIRLMFTGDQSNQNEIKPKQEASVVRTIRMFFSMKN